MPNIKSAKKRVLIAKVNNERNKADKSALKTTLKKFEAAVTEGNREQADSAYQASLFIFSVIWLFLRAAAFL